MRPKGKRLFEATEVVVAAVVGVVLVKAKAGYFDESKSVELLSMIKNYFSFVIR